MSDDSPMTFVYAPEIEDQTIAILWHQPDRLPGFLRSFDPAVHFAQPHARIILEALNIARGESGFVDWPIGVEVLREMGKLDQCGGLEGLNRIYSMYTPGAPFTDDIFAEYLRLLSLYATHRATEPGAPFYLFTGGRATLCLNKAKGLPNQPDYIGKGKIRGQSYRLRGWFLPDHQSVNILIDPQ
jgi:hypothetical protein